MNKFNGDKFEVSRRAVTYSLLSDWARLDTVWELLTRDALGTRTTKTTTAAMSHWLSSNDHAFSLAQSLVAISGQDHWGEGAPEQWGGGGLQKHWTGANAYASRSKKSSTRKM